MTITVPNKYSGGEGDSTFTLPNYDQDYTIEYSFSPAADGEKNFTDTRFPLYNTAVSSMLVEKHTYSFSGLFEDDADTVKEFLAAFNNSWQPFTLGTLGDFIIAEDPVLTKDRFNLHYLTLTLIRV